MIRPSERWTVAQNCLSFSASPASSARMGIFLISINSVLMSLRFETSPKTKFAAGSVRRPCRGVPMMTGTNTDRLKSCAGISRFVAGTRRSLQSQFPGVAKLADRAILRIAETRLASSCHSRRRECSRPITTNFDTENVNVESTGDRCRDRSHLDFCAARFFRRIQQKLAAAKINGSGPFAHTKDSVLAKACDRLILESQLTAGLDTGLHRRALANVVVHCSRTR